ncbi:MAG: hypothetical protein ISR01_03270 [Chitinophagales bacterium]|nr:hypothetical protein [Chitinophagales bacterium]
MKNLQLFIFTFLSISLGLQSCDKNDDSCDCAQNEVCIDGICTDASLGDDVVLVSTNISSDTEWTKDKIYRLGGRITVLPGAKLTIQAGTIIKGEAGTGPNATALLVARGATIEAIGSAIEPIIFTSVADELTQTDIASGSFASPNLDPTQNGLWGGVIVLGNAPISASGSEINIEGIPTSDPNGLYGGNSSTESSGILQYISIRHGGANIGAGNEINGLTLGGVGSGTVIENIEVIANQDDGIEFFGGSVNMKNAVVWNVNDDAIDTDQSWSGTLDNFVVLTPLGHCFELDGPEGSMIAGHTIKNGLVYASNADRTSEDLINTDDNSVVDLENIFITGIAAGQQINRVDHVEGIVNFLQVNLDVPATDLGDYVNGSVPNGIISGTNSTTDVNVFGWTWAKQAAAF